MTCPSLWSISEASALAEGGEAAADHKIRRCPVPSAAFSSPCMLASDAAASSPLRARRPIPQGSIHTSIKPACGGAAVLSSM